MESKESVSLEKISKLISDFCRQRGWEKYHNPKNLSMALAIEAGELMEIFQWLTSDQSKNENLSPEQKAALRDEIADVVIYAIRLSQVLDFDLKKAINEKIKKNDKKYPIE